MKPEDALKLIDQICSQVSLPREGHLRVQAALDTLREATKKEDKTKED